jgi:hypothetical protein
VEISVVNSEPSLKPGSFAGCKVPLFESKGVIMVPDESILLRQGLKKIYVVRDDTARITDVVTGENSDGFTRIISGVDPGDVVVTVGQSFLQDKSAVTISDGREAGER